MDNFCPCFLVILAQYRDQQRDWKASSKILEKLYSVTVQFIFAFNLYFFIYYSRSNESNALILIRNFDKIGFWMNFWTIYNPWIHVYLFWLLIWRKKNVRMKVKKWKVQKLSLTDKLHLFSEKRGKECGSINMEELKGGGECFMIQLK